MPAKAITTDSPSTRKGTRIVWEKGERRFLVVALLLIGLFVYSLLWWGRLNELPELNIPDPVTLSPNAHDTYQQAMTMMARLPRAPVDPIFDDRRSPKTEKERAWRYSTARKAAWVQSNAASLRIFRQGLALPYQSSVQRTSARFRPMRWVSSFNYLARTVVVEGSVRRERGNRNGAAGSALDLLRFGHQLPQGADSGECSGALQIQSMGRRVLFPLVPQLSAPTCRRAARHLERMYTNRVTYADSLQEEKWATQSALLDVMRHPDWLPRIMQSGRGGSINALESLFYRFTSRREALDKYTNYMDGIIADAKKPYARSAANHYPSDQILATIAPYYFSRFSFARAEAGTTLLTLKLALRAYRLERGAYPENLQALVPNYVGAIPADPFGGGERLRYKKQGDSYILWSIGPDKRDDGGKPLPSRSTTQIYYWDDYDLSAPRDETQTGDWVIRP